MRPAPLHVTDILELLPVVFNAAFRERETIGSDGILEFKTLLIGALARILKSLEQWAQIDDISTELLKDLVLKTIKLARQFLPHIQSSSVQSMYLMGLTLKWMLIEDSEIRSAAMTTSMQYMKKIPINVDQAKKLAIIFSKILESKRIPSDETRVFSQWFEAKGVVVNTPKKILIPHKIRKDSSKTMEIPIIDEVKGASAHLSNLKYVKNISQALDKSIEGKEEVWANLAEKSLKRKVPPSLSSNVLNIKIPRPASLAKTKLQQIKDDMKLHHYLKPLEPAKRPLNRMPERVLEERRPSPPFPPERALSVDLPAKPQRSTKLIDIATIQKGTLITVPANGPSKVRLNDMTSLYKEVLSWNYFSKEHQRPKSLPLLQKIPDTFHSHSEYNMVFEPLLLMECWSQLNRGKEELAVFNKSLKLTCQDVVMFGEFNGKNIFYELKTVI